MSINLYTGGKYIDFIVNSKILELGRLKLKIKPFFTIYRTKPDVPEDVRILQSIGIHQFSIYISLGKEGGEKSVLAIDCSGYSSGVQNYHYVIEIMEANINFPEIADIPDDAVQWEKINALSHEEIVEKLSDAAELLTFSRPSESLKHWCPDGVLGLHNLTNCAEHNKENQCLTSLLESNDCIDALYLTIIQHGMDEELLKATRSFLCWRELSGFFRDYNIVNFSRRIFEKDAEKIKGVYKANIETNLTGKNDHFRVHRFLERYLKNFPDEAVREESEEYLKLVSKCLVSMVENSSSEKIVSENGRDFEERVMKKLRLLGYEARPTPATGDFGADIVAEAEGLVYVIQCKAHNKPVGVKAVQEAVSARKYYKGDYAVVVSLNGYTAAAREMASETNVALLGESNIHIMDSF